MSDVHVHKVQAAWKKRALIDNKTYLKWYKDSVADPDKFWGKHGKRIDWFKPYTKVKNTSYDGDVSIKWFEDGVTNVAHNCIDRHLKKRGDQVAIIWEGDNPYDDKKITYNELYEHVCRLANVLKKHGVKKGDRVTITLSTLTPPLVAISTARSVFSFRGIFLTARRPSSAVMTKVDSQSTMRPASESGEKPPNTTEWTAPMRAQASIA